MKTTTKHKLLDLKEDTNLKRDEALAGARVSYMNEITLMQQNLKGDLKAIRTAYKKRYEVARLEVISMEQQTTEKGD